MPFKDFKECKEAQVSKGKSEEEAAKICEAIQDKFEGAFDLDKCLEQQKAKGKDDEEAKKICAFIEKRQGATEEDYTEEEKDTPSKEDFESVGECVKHCIDTLGKTEDQANAFCTKLFEAKVAEVIVTGRNETITRLSQTNENVDKLFVKAFLLDDSVNLNQWGVNPATIEHNINSFIGKPLVLTEKFDHPVVDDMSYGHALQYQDLWRVGTIIDIVKNNKEKYSPYGNAYYAIIEVTNEAAKKAFQTGNLPLYVSPAIAQMELDEDAQNLNGWLALHLAIVDDPAYTVKKAQITGQCTGAQATCLLRLRQAHVQKFGYDSCGFCVYGKLTSVLTAKSNEKITEAVTKINTSLETEKQNSVQVHSMENNPVNVADVSKDTAAVIQTEVKAPTTPSPEAIKQIAKESVSNGIDLNKSGEEGTALLNAKYIQFKAEATILKEQKASLEKELADTKTELTTLKESLRKSQIASVVTEDLIADPKTRDDTIKFFMEAGLTPDQVKAVYESVGVTKSASVNTPSYEAKMPLVKTAKKSNQVSDDHDIEAIMSIADMIVQDDGGVQ